MCSKLQYSIACHHIIPKANHNCIQAAYSVMNNSGADNNTKVSERVAQNSKRSVAPACNGLPRCRNSLPIDIK